MHITEELIEKFFMEKCTLAEAEEVVIYLNRHTEILDKYLSKHEWDNAIKTDDKTEQFWASIWDEIKQKMINPKPRSLFLKYGIAASILLALVMFASIYFSQHTLTRHEQQQVAHAFTHKSIRNTGKISKEVTLTDGSIVTLFADAKIEYDEPFQNNRRDIRLAGEAVFKVAKDKTKPFTVFSGELSTTALGTLFKVSNIQHNGAITVNLYEGKVVVKSQGSATKRAENFYLYPGDKLVYNKQTASFNLTRKKIVAQMRQGHLLVFEKASLSDVFDQLASTYNVHIQYANDDFTQMYYIGSFDQSDSIQHILENIAKLNGLKLTKSTENEYIITK